MPENQYEREAVGEAWRKEIDRLMLSRKMAEASSYVGYASTYPTEENIKLAYGRINDAISFFPIGDEKTYKSTRDDILARMNTLRMVLYGDRNDPAVLKLLLKFGMGKSYFRAGINTVPALTNLPALVEELMGILIALNDFSVDAGLRIVKKEKKARGMEKLYEDEGMGNAD